MFQWLERRRRLRELLETLDIVPELDQVLDSHYVRAANLTEQIFARDCKPLGAKKVAALVSNLIRASRRIGHRKLVWVIGATKSPTDHLSGPTVAEESELENFALWFADSEATGCLRVNSKRYFEDQSLGTAGNVVVVRTSPTEYRASYCLYSHLTDLAGKAWKRMEYW